MISLTDRAHVDLEVYNEAGCWTISPTDLSSLDRDSLAKPDGWLAAFRAGAMVPIALVDDSSFSCRVVSGRELDEVERTAALRTRWWLELPEGGLTICAGSEWISGDFVLGDSEEYHHQLAVPPGRYVVDVLTYASGLNGGLACEEPLGRWWRQTRDEPMPLWLEMKCAEDPELDPGHDDHWESRAEELEDAIEASWDSRDQCPLDFLVHLTPLAEGAALPDEPALERGAIVGGERLGLSRCPDALMPHALIRPRGLDGDGDGDGDGWSDEPITGVDVAARLAGCELSPIEGGPVELPAEQLVDAFCLAFWSYDSLDGQIDVELPDGVEPWDSNEDGELLRDGNRLTLRWPQTGARWELWLHLEALGPGLAALPDGTSLALQAAPAPDDDDDDDDGQRADPDAGRMHLRGEIIGGRWRIRDAYPRLRSGTCQTAFALAAEVRAQHGFALRAGELAELRKRAEVDLLLKTDLQLTETTARIGGDLDDQIARHLFQIREAAAWPMRDLHASNQADHARWNAFGSSLTSLIAAPMGDQVIYYGSHGDFRPSPGRASFEPTGEPLAALDEALAAAGLRPLGSMALDSMADVVITGWYLPDRYIAVLTGIFGLAAVDVFSLFADGSSLTTTTTAGSGDEPSKGIYRLQVSDPSAVDLPAMIAAHDARLAELVAEHGAARSLAEDLHGLAEAIDDFLDRQQS